MSLAKTAAAKYAEAIPDRISDVEASSPGATVGLLSRPQTTVHTPKEKKRTGFNRNYYNPGGSTNDRTGLRIGI